MTTRRGSAYAVDPFWIEERLVVVWRLIEPLPLHVKEIAPLQRNGADAADFVGVDGAGQRDLAGHRGAADDGVLQTQFLDHGGDAADVGFFVVRVVAGVVAFILFSVD